jgi:uncharacterized protein (DUF433 family)
MALPLPAKFPRIVRTPRVQGGEPVVRGTRVPVRAIVIAWQEYRDVAVLLEAYPRLTQADVAEALDFYEANSAELEGIIREVLGQP